ncbi:MAG: STT3 domain-containing protein [Methanotrichaceae archaeon]
MDRAKRYEPAEVLAVALLGLLLRLFAGRYTLTESGVLPDGADEYYHMRRILYTVDHFPSTLWSDSYLNYPHGVNLTWPPLFDQLSALLSIVLGQHTQGGVEMVSAMVPVIIGTIAVVAVYYMAKTAFNSNIAILSAFMTAISPYYIPKTEIGAIDHHGLEVLLFLCSILFLILALNRTEKRNLFAVASGVMMAALAYTWLGASIYLGIILIYAGIQIIYNLKNRIQSKEFATTLLLAFGTALILTVPFGRASWLLPSFVGIAASTAAMLLMFAISKVMLEKNINWTIFPLALLAIAGATAVLSRLISNFFDIYALIQSGGDYLISGDLSGKISEAEPLLSNSGSLFTYSLASSLGWPLILNLVLSIAGLVVLVVYIMRKGEEKKGQLFILIWAVASLLLTVAQIRFLYLSTIATGILISILFFWALDVIGKHTAMTATAKSSKAIAIVLLLLLIIPTVSETMNFTSNVPQTVGDWDESLKWLESNSNSTSFYENPDKTPEYGIMNFWDCGNWVVYLAKRPVTSDNFQSGVADSVRFYLSQDEAASTAVLDARKSKYVLVDYNMLYSKLPGIVAWTNEDPSSYLVVKDSGSDFEATPTQKLMGTTMARLYFFNGAGMGHFRLVHGSPTFVGTENPDSMIKIFEYVPGAIIKVSTGPNQKVGALLNLTSNQWKEFYYINEGTLKDGKYEIRVPYSTENKYGIRAIDPYMIFSGSDKGIKTQNISVSEKDVLDGRTINVSFESE